MTRARVVSFRVLGQVEGLSYNGLEAWAEGGLVCVAIRGPDGNAYATMHPELAQAVVTGLRGVIREAADQTPVPDPDLLPGGGM